MSIGLISQVNHDCFRLGERSQRVDSSLPANAALLRTSERRVVEHQANAVDTDHAAVEV